MTIFIGTDEAGYGPNLGPLVVSASCWRYKSSDYLVDYSTDILTDDSFEKQEDIQEKHFFSKIKNVQTSQYIQRTFFDLAPPLKEPPKESIKVHNDILDAFHSFCRTQTDYKSVFPIVDSKKLFKASRNLAPLERTFLQSLIWMQGPIHSLSYADILTLLDDVSELPFWEKDHNIPLPFDCQTNSFDLLNESFKPIQSYFDAHQISLLKLKSRRVFPKEFNEKTKTKLKSDFLAEITLSLVSKMLDFVVHSIFQKELIIILCDKLGGRNKYASLLTSFFPKATISTLYESRALSVYELILPINNKFFRFEIRFQMKGESNVPTALASICSKYLREISMKMFNDFWRQRIPNLQPTAGYPVDARRFYRDIQKVKKELKCNDNDIWRNK